MLILLIRLPWVVLRGLRRPKLDLGDESVLTMRVWPNDLDWYMHVNNGRYLTLMDLGRTDFSVRTVLMKLFRKRRWQPVAGAVTIRFRRSLQPFQRYTLTTRMAGWNERWWFFEQRFEAAGELYALAYAKVAILEKGKPLPAAQVLDATGWSGEQPTLPEGIVNWQRSDAS